MIYSHLYSIKFDMDDEHNYLIGSHGYCTQVMRRYGTFNKGTKE